MLKNIKEEIKTLFKLKNKYCISVISINQEYYFSQKKEAEKFEKYIEFICLQKKIRIPLMKLSEIFAKTREEQDLLLSYKRYNSKL